jgi:hypothetical protein
MKLDVRALVGESHGVQRRRVQEAARELQQLLTEYGIAPTPLVVARLEEFLVLYHIVQGIDARIRNEGLFVAEAPVAKRGAKAGTSDAGEAATVPARPAKLVERLHPLVEAATKQRERLTKAIKEIEGMIAAHAAAAPSLAELLSPLTELEPEDEA